MGAGAARASRRAVRVGRARFPIDTLEAVGGLFGVYVILEGALVVLIGIRGTRYRGAFIAEGTFGVVAGLVALACRHRARAPVRRRRLGDLERRRGDDRGRRAAPRDNGRMGPVPHRDPLCRPRGGDGSPARRGLLSLIWLVGLYVLAAGVALIVLALRVRNARGRGNSRVR